MRASGNVLTIIRIWYMDKRFNPWDRLRQLPGPLALKRAPDLSAKAREDWRTPGRWREERRAPICAAAQPHREASVVGAAGGGLDKLPEFRVFLEGFVFADGQAGTEEEILEAVLAQDAVHDDAKLVPLEIDAVIAEAEAVQELVVPLQPAETLKVGAHDFLGQAAKLAEDLQLELLGHLGELGGAGGVEDDLEGAHESVVLALDEWRMPRQARDIRS